MPPGQDRDKNESSTPATGGPGVLGSAHFPTNATRDRFAIQIKKIEHRDISERLRGGNSYSQLMGFGGEEEVKRMGWGYCSRPKIASGAQLHFQIF